MTVKIRLTRLGRKGVPFYRIVVVDSRKARDGAYIEKVGHYDPLKEVGAGGHCLINRDRIAYWVSVGAQMTDRVKWLLQKCPA